MTVLRLRLLQYSVGSHSRKGEVIKQQLVQTALQQGLCDLALVQGCTGIHEPIRSGVGAVFQPAASTLPSSDSSHSQGGTMVCYTADRFRVRQLSSVAEDLPGFVHSILLVQEVSTSTPFIAIVLSSDAGINSAPDNASQLVKLWNLMLELSTQCAILTAGDCRLSSAADTLCSNPSIQVHSCQPVQHVSTISQSFFAASPKHQIQITGVESLLARPAAASAHYTQNAHTATCCITWEGSSAPPREASVELRTSADPSTDHDSRTLPTSSTFQPEGPGTVAAQLRVLVDAASMGVAETVPDAKQPYPVEDSPGSAKGLSPYEAVHLRASCSFPHVADKNDKGRGKALPAPLTIQMHYHVHQAEPDKKFAIYQTVMHSELMIQGGASEIEPKPMTPAYGRAAVYHQLTQTSSGNLCFAGSTAQSDSYTAQGNEEGYITQLQTPAPFQLQPNPSARQLVDINTLRIMQLRRSISELSASNVPLDSRVSEDPTAMATELNAVHAQHQRAAGASGEDTDRLAPDSDVVGISMMGHQNEQVAVEHSGRSIDEQGDGLYAAAKQAPGDLKAAWHKHVQQPPEKKALRKHVKGRSSEDRLSSPGRLLKCLQARTDSDVEAEMQAMQFKH